MDVLCTVNEHQKGDIVTDEIALTVKISFTTQKAMVAADTT